MGKNELNDKKIEIKRSWKYFKNLVKKHIAFFVLFCIVLLFLFSKGFTAIDSASVLATLTLTGLFFLFFSFPFLLYKYLNLKNYRYYYNNECIYIEHINTSSNKYIFFEDIKHITLKKKSIEYGNIIITKLDNNIEILESILDFEFVYNALQDSNIKTQHINKKSIENNKLEHKRKCNICGKIWCYTDEDILQNEKIKKRARNTSISATLSILNNNKYDFNENIKQGLAFTNQIKDYSKCPECNSIDTIEIFDEKIIETNKEISLEKNNDSNISSADEIKKYKELLDNGIITQEEFEQKKKQLLNL